MARPRKEIDGEQVFKLAQLGCSYREIAAKFGVDEKTVRNRFSAEKELGDASGITAIRRWQMKRAQAGSDRMLEVLGKNRLGQTDKTEIHQSAQLSLGPTPELEAALAAYGYVRTGTTMGSTEPGTLCDTGE
jgi:transposase